jgi:hypothetical protein
MQWQLHSARLSRLALDGCRNCRIGESHELRRRLRSGIADAWPYDEHCQNERAPDRMIRDAYRPIPHAFDRS